MWDPRLDELPALPPGLRPIKGAPSLYISDELKFYAFTPKAGLFRVCNPYVDYHPNGHPQLKVHWHHNGRSRARVVHNLLWIDQVGDLPQGAYVLPIDGDIYNLDISNFKLITGRARFQKALMAANKAKAARYANLEKSRAEREAKEEEAYQRALAILGKTE